MLEAVAKLIDLLMASGWQTAMIAAACAVFLYLTSAGVVPAPPSP